MYFNVNIFSNPSPREFITLFLLSRLQGAPLLQLRVFISSASDIRYQALPRALTSASAFQKAVNKLVYDVLMIMVRFSRGDPQKFANWTLRFVQLSILS